MEFDDEIAATQVFERDCLIYLGTCVAPAGPFNPRRSMLRFQTRLPDGTGVNRVLSQGELVHFPLPRETPIEATITPLQRELDVGAGPGRPLHTTLQGGVVGLVIDTRGRPLQLPEDAVVRVPMLQRWVEALGEYPDAGAS
jgi:hypothetical protein